MTKKLLILATDGTGEPSYVRDLPAVIKDVAVPPHYTLAACALKSGDLMVLDLKSRDETADLVFRLHAPKAGVSCDVVSCSDDIMVLGSSDGRITIVPNPLLHPPKYVEVDWIGLFRDRPYLLLQPCCIDDTDDTDDALNSEEVSGGRRKSKLKRWNTSITSGLLGDKGGGGGGEGSGFPVTTPLHIMGHASVQKLLDVLPPCHTTALCAMGCRQSLLNHIFDNREHEKCMIIAKVYPIEMADNESGIAFAKWLVRLSGIYDDVIALAITTGVVPALGALPTEPGQQRRALPKEMYLPYKALDLHAMPDHNRTVVVNETPERPTNHPDTKAPVHGIVDTYTEHIPLWKYPHGDGTDSARVLRGPKIAVEAMAVGPPEFIRITFPALAKAGSVEVFQTDIMGIIVKFLWERVRRYYVRQWRQFCVLLLSFVLGIYM